VFEKRSIKGNKKGRKRGEDKKKLEPRFFRKKVCRFCKEKKGGITYREVEALGNFLNERGKILPGRISGNCAKHQRIVGQAIKRAREVALLPFVSE
jgi:small subunit ribosomal protein S18